MRTKSYGATVPTAGGSNDSRENESRTGGQASSVGYN